MVVSKGELQRVTRALDDRDIPYRTGVCASQLSTVKAGGTIAVVVEPESYFSVKQLAEVLETLNTPYFVMGAMSNTLVPMDGYPLAISTRRLKGIEVIGNRVYAGGGESLQNLIAKTAQCGLSGLEALAGIPASVGGAVFMNAGCYGHEISDTLASITVFDFDLLRGGHLLREQMEFSYRSSGLLQDRELVLGAEFVLTEDQPTVIKARIDAYRKKRKETQPTEPSLGCAFLKSNGVGAGYYIDQAGLKGQSQGGMRVSETHAGFLVNGGSGTAADYSALLDVVKARVKQQFGIQLKEEIRLL